MKYWISGWARRSETSERNSEDRIAIGICKEGESYDDEGDDEQGFWYGYGDRSLEEIAQDVRRVANAERLFAIEFQPDIDDCTRNQILTTAFSNS